MHVCCNYLPFAPVGGSVQSLLCSSVCSAALVSRHHSLWRSQQIHASSCASARAWHTAEAAPKALDVDAAPGRFASASRPLARKQHYSSQHPRSWRPGRELLVILFDSSRVRLVGLHRKKAHRERADVRYVRNGLCH